MALYINCKRSLKRLLLYMLAILLIYCLIHVSFLNCGYMNKEFTFSSSKPFIHDSVSNKTIFYDRNMPLIFIGGMPRSGTTLMRVILDTHSEVRCGEETRVIPRILGMRSIWERSIMEKQRLIEAGISDRVLDGAITSFILEIIARHGNAAPRLCNKDPFTLKSCSYLSRLFPSAKFILMIRDGRAVVNSIVSRKVTISGFDLKDFRGCMKKWNTAMEVMYSQCINVGSTRCMPVYYEQLVLHPEVWLRRILQFLNLPWSDSVLHHEDFVDKGGVKLSKIEKSTDQVIKPINLESLHSWVEGIPADVKTDMSDIAPMLAKLGYDPNAYPPDYGKPDTRVSDNTLHISQNKEYWKTKGESIERLREEVLQKARKEIEHRKALHKASN